MNASVSLECQLVNGEKFMIGERREIENGGISGGGKISKTLVGTH